MTTINMSIKLKHFCPLIIVVCTGRPLKRTMNKPIRKLLAKV